MNPLCRSDISPKWLRNLGEKSEGVKQIGGWMGLEKFFFIPIWGGNVLHTFTNCFLGVVDGFGTCQKSAFFAQKPPFVKVCEIYIYVVVLLLENLFLYMGSFVKVGKAFSSLCEAIASLKWKVV